MVGAGQSPGEGIGNGRATVVLRFAQEGSQDPCRRPRPCLGRGDRRVGRRSRVANAYPSRPMSRARRRSPRRWRRPSSAGAASTSCTTMSAVSIAGGDKPLDELTEACCSTGVRNQPARHDHGLRKHVLLLDHAAAAFRETIVNISSVAAYENTYPLVAYKATKAAMIAFTEQLALHNAPYGIRANCILPGLMDTPMAGRHQSAGQQPQPRPRSRRRGAMPGHCRWQRQDGHRLGRRQRGARSSRRTRPISSLAWPCRSDGGALVKVGWEPAQPKEWSSDAPRRPAFPTPAEQGGLHRQLRLHS